MDYFTIRHGTNLQYIPIQLKLSDFGKQKFMRAWNDSTQLVWVSDDNLCHFFIIRCALPAITIMALWQFVHLGHTMCGYTLLVPMKPPISPKQDGCNTFNHEKNVQHSTLNRFTIMLLTSLNPVTILKFSVRTFCKKGSRKFFVFI